MIIKGGSRAGASQLARHLGRTDTNERVKVLELQSPTGSVHEAFRDWQVLAAGTKGTKGLYHANIDPDAKYSMTPEQWARAVDVLEEELGLTGQPRAVVLHEKNGREHIHVVWQRTDVDRMTLRSDSHNYLAHERASLRLEREFGHEVVPGKHAKRDREAQPDMPDAKIDHAEWQQNERVGQGHIARKEQVRVLFVASDGGPAFKAALEDAGYLLARGDRRDFVLIDGDGRVHSLARQLQGVTAKDLRAFMDGVDPADLPGVAEARAKVREAAQLADRPDARVAELLAAIAKAHGAQREELDRRHGAEISALQEAQQKEASEEIDRLAKEWTRREMSERPGAPGAWERMWRELREAISEDLRKQRIEGEQRAAAERDADYQQAARQLVGGLEAKHRAELKELVGKQAEEQTDLYRSQEKDRDRRQRDDEQTRALQREYEQRQQDAISRDREGPERGDRAR